MAPLMSIGVTFGAVVLYLVSYLMHISHYDKSKAAIVLVSFNAIFALIQIIGCLTIVPNSPYEKVARGELEAAKNILKGIYLD